MYKVPPGLAPLALVPGLAFEALVRLRNRAYSSHWLRRHRLDSAVISIGNITMGGTGKTPLVIHIARVLLKLGYTPAVLSRGYGRISTGPQILSPGADALDAASLLGDEPALIRRRVPAAWMGISGNRFESGTAIERRKKGVVFLLDDGFQHRKLHRDLDIVVIDRSQPLESNRVFPRGTLREPLSALHRCQVIAINGARDENERLEREMKKLNLRARIFACEQKISAIIPFAEWRESIECTCPDSRIKTVYAVTALGNPARFLRDMDRIGIDVKGERLFPDHHRFSRDDWNSCSEEARKMGVDAMITTEKDAVKIAQPPGFPLMIAVQSTEMPGAEAFERILKDCIGGRS